MRHLKVVFSSFSSFRIDTPSPPKTKREALRKELGGSKCTPPADPYRIEKPDVSHGRGREKCVKILGNENDVEGKPGDGAQKGMGWRRVGDPYHVELSYRDLTALIPTDL